MTLHKLGIFYLQNQLNHEVELSTLGMCLCVCVCVCVFFCVCVCLCVCVCVFDCVCKQIQMKRPVRNITKRVLYFSQAVDIAIYNSFRIIPTVFWSNADAGNYFRPQAKMGHYLCLACQILVKYANSKLKMEASRLVCCPLLV